MSAPIDRLRAADPAAHLGRQPDERGEADLRLLLAEPHGAPASAAVRSPFRPERRRLIPILVTGVVAIAVIAGTFAVFGAVRPRVDVGGSVAPTPRPSTCHPAEVLPFQCGTYESTYGGKAVTGDLGGPAKDRLQISFTQQDGALLLTASTINCFAETVLVRYDGKRLIRLGRPEYSENDCHGPSADKTSWAYDFLRGSLELNGPQDYGSGDTAVYFEYQGAAQIGEQQLPRNDLRCVAAHVAPFSCGTYRSVAGTGALAFLGAQPTTMGFSHLNGALGVALAGWCNSLDSTIAVDGEALISYGVGGTQRGCGRMPVSGSSAPVASPLEQRDDAWRMFFTGVLTYRITDNTITFVKGATSATFTR